MSESLPENPPFFPGFSAPRGSLPVRQSASVFRLLEWALTNLQRPASPSVIWRSVRQALADCKHGDWATQLDKAGRRLGLHTRPFVGGGQALTRELHHGAAALTLLSREDGSSVWLMVVKKRSHRLEILLHGDQEETRQTCKLSQWLSVAASLGISESSGWTIVESAGPLEVINSSEVLDSGGQPGRFGVPWLRLKALIRLETPILVVILSYALFAGLLTLISPVAVQALVNTIAFGSLVQPLVVLTLLLLVGWTARVVLESLEAYAVEMLQRRIFVRMSEDLVRRLPRLSAKVISRRDGPEAANRFFEVVNLNKGASALLVEGLAVALQTCVGLVLLAFYHPLLLAFALVIITALIALLLIPARAATQTALVESEAKYRSAAWLQNVAASPEVFGRQGAGDFAAAHGEILTREYLSARKAHFARVFKQLIGGKALQAFTAVTLLGVGGVLVMQGQLTLGQLVAAELIVGLVGQGFSSLGKQLERFYDLLAGMEELGEVIDLEQERDGHLSLRASRPWAVSFEGTRFHYPIAPGLHGAHAEVGQDAANQAEANHFSLGPITAFVAPGTSVALRGPSAAGKSTVLDLLWLRFDPSEGQLRFDDTEGSSLDRAEARDHIMLLRGTSVFPSTIEDNLLVVCPHASDERVTRALENAELSSPFFNVITNRTNSLSSRANPLSSSQAARLMLARAFLSKPRLLLIDGLLEQCRFDSEEKTRVCKRLLGGSEEWTVFIVSDDETFVSACQQRWLFDNGQVRVEA